MARNRYAVARRSIWYILKALIITIAVIALCLGMFVMGMYVSNIYILTTEGMEKRAQCILMDTSIYELAEYFTEEFVRGDNALYEGRYSEFTVSGFDYRLEIEKFYILPWNTTANMHVLEYMASIAAQPNAGGDGVPVPELPEWGTARYVITFTQDGTRWYISGLTLIEANPHIAPKPTPDYSQLD